MHADNVPSIPRSSARGASTSPAQEQSTASSTQKGADSAEVGSVTADNALAASAATGGSDSATAGRAGSVADSGSADSAAGGSGSAADSGGSDSAACEAVVDSGKAFFPHAVVGVLGGGQLGRMSILAGRHMGYRFSVYEPSQPGSAAMVADAHLCAAYEDKEALEQWARGCSVVTLEFENIAQSAARAVTDAGVPLRPSAHVLHICQNRAREKAFLQANGIPCAPFVVVHNSVELARAVEKLGTPCVLKTADFGYDGKGQRKIESAQEDWDLIWADFAPAGAAVLEAWIPFRLECSAIVARGVDGEVAVFPIAENSHKNHILHQSIVPARIPEIVQKEAGRIAKKLVRALDCIGLLAVEFFYTQDGKLLVNEMAPRPHNSGHYSMDACQCSQFEQHIRAVCGLPLGSTRLLRPAVMVNLLGDTWKRGQTPHWQLLLNDPHVKLHLYDKGTPRPSRKMGHFTVLADTVDEALARADYLYAKIMRG